MVIERIVLIKSIQAGSKVNEARKVTIIVGKR